MNNILSIAIAFSAAIQFAQASDNIAKIGKAPLVVQVIGAPASGKSKAIERLEKFFHPDIRQITEKLRDVDLDVIRAKFNMLDGQTKFYIVVRALDLYRRIGILDENNENITFKWQSEDAENLLEMFHDGGKIREAFKKQLGVDVSYDKVSGLMINGVNTTQEELGKKYNLQILFENFDNVTLGNIINRYEVLVAVIESVILQTGLRLDNVGSTSKDIIGRLKFLRDKNYASLSIIIHPKTVLFNLLLNSIRAYSGGHYTPNSMILKKYSAIDAIMKEYTSKSEQELLIEKNTDLSEITKRTAEITIEDNRAGENTTKSIDLILIDKTQGIDDAISIVEKITNKKTCKSLWIASIADIYNQACTLNANYTGYSQKMIDEIKEADSILNFMKEASKQDIIDTVEQLAKDNVYVRKVFENKDKIKKLINDLYAFCGITEAQ